MNDPAAATNANTGEANNDAESREAWVFPTSFGQRRLWLIDQVERGGALYNVPSAFRVRGRLDPGALEQSIAGVIARHEILRTTFRAVDGEPVQVVAPAAEFHLPVVDLRALSPAAREAEVSRIIRDVYERSFDLGKGPLLRAALLELGPAEQVLVLCLHHIVTDAWSHEVLMGEITSSCSALAAGDTLSLPELPIQYAEFAVWQRDAMQGKALEKELGFWREKLSGLTPLELPHLPGPAPVHAPDSATFAFDLPEPLAAAARAMANAEGVALFMVLLAAWKVLLARYAGQTDIAVGSPISSRDRTETEGLIGFFLNTLVLRTDLSGNPGVREALHRVRDTVLEAVAHKYLPFEKIVTELQPARRTARNSLIGVMFNLETGEEKTWRTPDATLEPLYIEESKAKFDLELYLRETGRGINGQLVYDKTLFSPAMVRRMAGHYQTLLAGMAAHPESTIGSLPLILPEERECILHEWNDTAAPFPPDALLHGLFEAQAERSPGAVAVVFGEEHLTYAELNRRANQLAHRLQKLGVAPDVLAGICMERSLEMVVAMLAVLKAGGAYVPLDPTYPRERIALMIEDAQMPVILAQARFASLCGGGAPRVLCVDTEDCEEENPANPAGDFGAGRLAYVMYTSGSTGKPKGVMIEHRALCNFTLWMQAAYPVDERDRILQQTSISFDPSVWEFFSPLCAGAQLVMAQPGGHRDSRYLVEAVARHGITTLQVVPSMLRMLVEEPGLEACNPSLRRLFCIGEALAPDLCDKLFARLCDCELINIYGPTECTIAVTFYRCARGAKIVPIGRPVANTRLYILDAESEPAPIGVPGELHIAGVQLARGYWRNPKQTATAFVHYNGERVYKTGDLARWLPDGKVDCLGRADNQVKIRGFRIEPGEIEAALRRQPGVADCAVVAREEAPGDKRLVAYVVREQGGAVATEGALIAALRNSMPDHMVPSAIVFLEALPRTPNGKLDRRALPAPDYGAPREGSAIFIAPRTELEARLAEIWQEVLGVERIGIHDNFMALGGESLLALRIVNRLRGMLGGKDVFFALLFQAPTIALLAETLRTTCAAAVESFVDAPAKTGPPRAGQTSTDDNGAKEEPARKEESIPRLSRGLRPVSSSVRETAD